MKALVKKYNECNELTFVEVGDEVMYYSAAMSSTTTKGE